MTPEQQRIAIAEACGITNAEYLMRYGAMEEGETLPDYLTDLNAMHEAEKVLTRIQYMVYSNYLDNEFAYSQTIYAKSCTAAQRAEAFLRTLNLWEPCRKMGKSQIPTTIQIEKP